MALEAFFKDRVYAISGGASGIGLATSKILLRYGAKISVGDIRFPDGLLDELTKDATASGSSGKVEDSVLLQKVDVRSRTDVESWISETISKFGKLDGAVNLAGTIPKDHNIGSIEDIDDEQWKFVMDVNVYGIMNCMRAQLKYIGKGHGDRSGKDWSIVNAGSGLSLQGREFTGVYSTSKHAVLGLTRCAAKEVGKRGIRVNCIAPGGTDTPLMRQSMAISEGSASAEDFSTTALGRMAQPSEIADTVRAAWRASCAFAPSKWLLSSQRWYSSAPPATVTEESKNAISPRWLSDTKSRIGRCITFGLTPKLVDEAGQLLKILGRDWRELVAGSEGYLTSEKRAGLHRQSIVWGEQDSMGHVNNVMYVRFAESGRCNWIRNYSGHLDPTHRRQWEELLTSKSVGLILKSITVDFKFPMTWPDRISVYHKLRSRPDESTESLILDVLIMSEVRQRPAARCLEDVVVYDYRLGKKSTLEPFMLEQFKKTFDLQEAAKSENRGKIQQIDQRVRTLEKRSWDSPDAKEDFGTAQSR